MTVEAIFKINKVVDVKDIGSFVEVPESVTYTESSAIEMAVLENKHYSFTKPLTSLTIISIPTSPIMSSISFSLDIQGATVSLPASVDTVGNTVFEPGKKYILIIMMGTIFIFEKN